MERVRKIFQRVLFAVYLATLESWNDKDCNGCANDGEVTLAMPVEKVVNSDEVNNKIRTFSLTDGFSCSFSVFSNRYFYS